MTDLIISSGAGNTKPRQRIFEAQCEANLAEVSWLRGAMSQRLAECALPRQVIEDLALALSEVAGNAISQSQPAPTQLGVVVDVVGQGLFMELTDNGGGLGAFIDQLKEAHANGINLDGAADLAPSVLRAALDLFRYHPGPTNRFVGWKSLKGKSLIAFEEASHAVDALYQSTFGEGARVVGVIGVKSGDGVSACARSLARRCALTKRRTLLLDLSGSSEDRGAAGQDILQHKDGYELVTLRPRGDDLFLYRSQEVLRELLTKVYAEYQAIIVDCAPTSTREEDPIPGHIIARCTDAVLLVCLGGKTTKQAIADAKRALANANVRGVVVNRRDQVTLGEELARQAMRTSRFAPKLARGMAQRFLNSRFLDVHI